MSDKPKKSQTEFLAEQLREGYALMADINLEIAESGVTADNEALEVYEKLLTESEFSEC